MQQISEEWTAIPAFMNFASVKDSRGRGDSCRPPGVAFWVANKQGRLGTYSTRRVAPLLPHKALPPLRSVSLARCGFYLSRQICMKT